MNANVRRNTIGVVRSVACEGWSTWRKSKRQSWDWSRPTSAFSRAGGQSPLSHCRRQIRRRRPPVHFIPSVFASLTPARAPPLRAPDMPNRGLVLVRFFLRLFRRLLGFFLFAAVVGGGRGLRGREDDGRGRAGANPQCPQQRATRHAALGSDVVIAQGDRCLFGYGRCLACHDDLLLWKVTFNNRPGQNSSQASASAGCHDKGVGTQTKVERGARATTRKRRRALRRFAATGLPAAGGAPARSCQLRRADPANP